MSSMQPNDGNNSHSTTKKRLITLQHASGGLVTMLTLSRTSAATASPWQQVKARIDGKAP